MCFTFYTLAPVFVVVFIDILTVATPAAWLGHWITALDDVITRGRSAKLWRKVMTAVLLVFFIVASSRQVLSCSGLSPLMNTVPWTCSNSCWPAGGSRYLQIMLLLRLKRRLYVWSGFNETFKWTLWVNVDTQENFGLKDKAQQETICATLC